MFNFVFFKKNKSLLNAAASLEAAAVYLLDHRQRLASGVERGASTRGAAGDRTGTLVVTAHIPGLRYAGAGCEVADRDRTARLDIFQQAVRRDAKAQLHASDRSTPSIGEGDGKIRPVTSVDRGRPADRDCALRRRAGGIDGNTHGIDGSCASLIGDGQFDAMRSDG